MYLKCKEFEVVSSLEEFKRLTLRQIQFFIDKRKEYEDVKQKNKELNERFNKKK